MTTGPAPEESPAADRPPATAIGPAGAGIVQASGVGTVLFAATAGLAAAVPEADLAALVVALVLFAGGTGAFAAALVRAAGRSRREELTMAGVFFLEGAPGAVRRLLLGSLAVEVVVAFVTAGVRPNSSLAFGILAPVWGQGLAGLWGARHGTFPPRRPGRRPGAAPEPAQGQAPDRAGRSSPAVDPPPS